VSEKMRCASMSYGREAHHEDILSESRNRVMRSRKARPPLLGESFTALVLAQFSPDPKSPVRKRPFYHAETEVSRLRRPANAWPRR